jgi:adenine-specific DNA-methyltransferase
MTSALPLDIFSGRARFDAKERGAYYTDDLAADFLVRWSLPASNRKERVLDPSFGGGVFLRAAARSRCAERAIYGVEIEETTFGAVGGDLVRSHGLQPDQLIHADFFAVDPHSLPQMDAVVGNPPFIRYQRFTGASRDIALRRSREAGVLLPKLASSWAPFVVHSVRFLREGGRLGMVLPMELGYAGYARPVIAFLAKSFARLRIVSFRHALFPQLSEEVVLLLAEDRRTPDGRLAEASLHDLADAAALNDFDPDEEGVDLAAFIRGHRRLAEFFLPSATRELYARVEAIGLARRLGELAEVGIGYVSGNNGFFHPNREDQARWGLPLRLLRRAVFNGSAFAGLEFSIEDWESAELVGAAGHLLHTEPSQSACPVGLQNYLEHGRKAGVAEAYKCAVRKVWHTVPHVYVGDGFLTYMNGNQTRLVANAAAAVAPNTLHLVRLRRESPLGIYELAARWLTSLTQLSVEIEGHALGGGMLKLEPREAQRVLVAAGHHPAVLSQEVAREFDVLLRANESRRTRELADRLFLRDELGLSETDCARLAEGALLLRNRRVSKKGSAR